MNVFTNVKTSLNKDVSPHLYLFMLMMLDYFFTYIGVNQIGIIREGNPMLIWLFEIPFIYSLIIRIFYSLLVITLCVIIEQSGYKHYKTLINSFLIINAGVTILHFRWILEYYSRITI